MNPKLYITYAFLLTILPISSQAAKQTANVNTCGSVLSMETDFTVNIEFAPEPHSISGQGFRLIARSIMKGIQNPFFELIENGSTDQMDFDTDKFLQARQKINCVQINEVKNVFTCLGYEKFIVNGTLWRLSIFSEGFSGITKGTVVQPNHPSGLFIREFIGGFNSPGTAMRGFFNSVPEQDLTTQERVFKKLVYEEIERRIGNPDEEFYLVSLPLTGFTSTTFFETASHELLHAQFRMDSNYRRAVKNFWSTYVSKADRDAFAESLASVYDVTNEETVIDEFQAYLLQRGSESGVYGRVAKYKGINFVEKYGTELAGKLKSIGIHFIELD